MKYPCKPTPELVLVSLDLDFGIASNWRILPQYSKWKAVIEIWA